MEEEAWEARTLMNAVSCTVVTSVRLEPVGWGDKFLACYVLKKGTEARSM